MTTELQDAARAYREAHPEGHAFSADRAVVRPATIESEDVPVRVKRFGDGTVIVEHGGRDNFLRIVVTADGDMHMEQVQSVQMGEGGDG